MSNNLRTRNGMPFNFVNGLKVRGMDIESLIPGIEGIPEAGSKYQFAGNGSNKAFTLPVTPYNKDAVDVYVKQLYVHPDDYTLVGDTVTLTEAPPALVAGETYNVVIKVSLTTLNGYVNANRVSFEGENLDDILEKGKPLANYSNLRTYAGAATQVRITDPGIAGFFYYDATDTTSTDNGGTIIVSANGKRWKRVFDGSVNVNWFGAIGDGVTNQGNSIRMAVAATDTGQTLFVPKGTYLLNAEPGQNRCVYITKQIHFIFEEGAVFKVTQNVRYVLVVSVSGVRINGNGATIDGNYQSNYGIATFSVNAFNVEGLICQNFYPATEVPLSSGGSTAGIALFNSSGGFINSCIIKNVKGLGTPSSIGTTGDSHGATSGIVLTGTAVIYGTNTIKNCIIDNIFNENTTIPYHDEDGINTQTLNSLSIVQDNYFTRCSKRGVKMMTPGIVSGNIIISSKGINSTDSTSMYSGISVYSQDVVVRDNVIKSSEIGGSCIQGIEIGVDAVNPYKNIKVLSNSILFSETSYGEYVYGIGIHGKISGLSVQENTITMPTALTNGAAGIRYFAHVDLSTMTLTDADISFNNITNALISIRILYPMKGNISNNRIIGNTSEIAINVETVSGSVVFSESITFINNDIKLNYSGNSFTWGIRVFDTRIKDCIAIGNKFNANGAVSGGSAVGINGNHTEILSSDKRKQFYGVTPPNNNLTTSPTLIYVRGDKLINVDPKDSYPIVSWVCRYGNTLTTAPVWIPSEFEIISGPTSGRPALTTNDRGVQYLDTTLAPQGKLITWNAFNWVDSNGTIV